MRLTAVKILLLLIGIGLLATVSITRASFLEPTAPPPGGQTGIFLDINRSVQKKLGSLMIGTYDSADPGASKFFCLNVTEFPVWDEFDPDNYEHIKCIRSWQDLLSISTGTFVNLRTTDPSSPSIPDNYLSDAGYARIIGNGGPANFTFTSWTNNTGSGATSAVALATAVAMPDQQSAAYLVGRLRIDHGLGTVTPAQLCLNGNLGDLRTVGNPNGACIRDWTDIAGAGVSDYVKAQLAHASGWFEYVDEMQSGYPQLSKTGNFGAVALGSPPIDVWPAEYITSSFCGDGQCSQEIGEDAVSGSAFYCPFDCEPVPGAASLVVTPKDKYNTVTFKTSNNFTGQFGLTPYILIARTDSQIFNYTPMIGVRYKLGGDSSFNIIYAQDREWNRTYTFDDYGVSPSTQYTYWVYQATAYPRYNVPANVLKTTITTLYWYSGPGGGGGGGGEPPDPGPIQRPVD